MIIEARKIQSSLSASKSPLVPRLNLYGASSPVRAANVKEKQRQNGLDSNGQSNTGSDVSSQKSKPKPQGVTWNLEKNETKEPAKKQNVPKLTESSCR